MFQNIVLIEKFPHPTDDRLYMIKHQLIDTEFIEDITLVIPTSVYHKLTNNALMAVSAVYIYVTKHKTNILKMINNIIEFYCLTTIPEYQSLSRWSEYDKIVVDVLFPDIKYGSTYYPCVLNRIKILEFTGMHPILHNAKYLDRSVL